MKLLSSARPHRWMCESQPAPHRQTLFLQYFSWRETKGNVTTLSNLVCSRNESHLQQYVPCSFSRSITILALYMPSSFVSVHSFRIELCIKDCAFPSTYYTARPAAGTESAPCLTQVRVASQSLPSCQLGRYLLYTRHSAATSQLIYTSVG